MGRLADLLATRHEVTVIGVEEPSEELAAMAVASEDQRRSAAVLEAIEAAYGDEGPDYLEVVDRRAPGLVPLQARRAGHPALRGTRIGVRLAGTGELIALHDGSLADPGMEILCDLERAQLERADRLLWPGGDGLDLYRRHYGDRLPEGAQAPLPLELPEELPAPARRDSAEPLRILFAGGFSRSKGAGDLAEACLRLSRDDWRLTMVGADTPTTVFKQSMRASIATMFGGDPRVALEGPLPRAELWSLMGEHDLLVAPSRFDLWPAVVIEAMACGLPVLATPVGGLAEIVDPDVTGWFTSGIGRWEVRDAIARLLESREEVEKVRGSGAPLERARGLVDPDRVLASYDELFEKLEPPAPSPRAVSPQEPLVTGVVPYFRASAHVEEAVDSLFAQSHGNIEALIVNDGSFEPEDEVLERLAERDRVTVVTQLNGGEASARNLGALVAEGEYVLMLDADNAAEPEFVARALELYRREPDLAYVSCWQRFIAPDGSPYLDPAGYAPLGNSVVRDDVENWDGDTFALIDRRLFSEHGYRYEAGAATHSDWEIYRVLRDDGRFGAIIPERLIRYRVHPESLMRSFSPELQERGWEEARGRRLARRTRWTVEA